MNNKHWNPFLRLKISKKHFRREDFGINHFYIILLIEDTADLTDLVFWFLFYLHSYCLVENDWIWEPKHQEMLLIYFISRPPQVTIPLTFFIVNVNKKKNAQNINVQINYFKAKTYATTTQDNKYHNASV